MSGNWEINIDLDSMPEKVATAFGEIEDLVGASYYPIAYLGSQLVNGTNHAVLAEQTITDKEETKNIVLIRIYESLDGVTSAEDIEVVLEGGNDDTGVIINVEKGDSMNKTAQALFDTTFGGFVETIRTPFAFLGTQKVRDYTEYIYAAVSAPAIDSEEDGDVKEVVIVRILDNEEKEYTETEIL